MARGPPPAAPNRAQLSSKAAEMEREIVKQVREALAGTLPYVDRNATFRLESEKEGWQRGEARSLIIQIKVHVPGTDDSLRDARREAKAAVSAAKGKKKAASAIASAMAAPAPPPVRPPQFVVLPRPLVAGAAFQPPHAPMRGRPRNPLAVDPDDFPRLAAAAGLLPSTVSAITEELAKPARVKQAEDRQLAQAFPISTCFFYRCAQPRLSLNDPLCPHHNSTLLRVSQPESDALFYLLLAAKTMAASFQERTASSHRSCFCYAEGETAQALHFMRRPWMWAKTAHVVLITGSAALGSEELRTHLETEAAALGLQTQRNPDDRGKLEIFSSALPETRLFVRILSALPKNADIAYPSRHCGAFQLHCAIPTVIPTGGAGFDGVKWPTVDKDGRVGRHALPASAAGIAGYGPNGWKMHDVPAMRYLHPVTAAGAAPPPQPPPPLQASEIERSHSATSLGGTTYAL